MAQFNEYLGIYGLPLKINQCCLKSNFVEDIKVVKIRV